MCAVCVAVVAGIEVGGANEAKGDEIEKVVTKEKERKLEYACPLVVSEA